MPKYIIEETTTYIYEADNPEQARSEFLADSDRGEKLVAVVDFDVYPEDG
jgi:hypothetical protein